MREPRIKVSPEDSEAIYHCIDRIVGGEGLLDDRAKEVLCRINRKYAEFCGLEMLTHTEMMTHTHSLLRVPKAGPVSDDELLRRYTVLHPPTTKRKESHLEFLKAQLAANTPFAVEWRKRLLRRMGDVSQYMKQVKQCFSIWFNRTHKRFGTLWAERFKSILLEPSFDVVSKVAAYIDLNCVRAGIVSDPKDYRFCGYAEAVAGDSQARKGFAGIFGSEDWDKLQAEYRTLLFTTGSVPKEKKAAIAFEALQQVLRKGGKLSVPEVLRCKVRFFTQGAVLGSQAFVAGQLARLGKSTPPRPLPAVTDWGDLAVLRNIRGPLFA